MPQQITIERWDFCDALCAVNHPFSPKYHKGRCRYPHQGIYEETIKVETHAERALREWLYDERQRWMKEIGGPEAERLGREYGRTNDASALGEFEELVRHAARTYQALRGDLDASFRFGLIRS